MNAFKCVVATIAFSIAVLLTGNFLEPPSAMSVGIFFLSGFIGLNLADLFLLSAFTRIGSGRTLMIFSFQPVFLGFFGFVLFNQELSRTKILAILFMIACVFTLSYEKFKRLGHWEVKGPLFALMGVTLDSCGILLTRFSFDHDPHISVLEGNFYRCLGACVGFLITHFFFRPIPLIKKAREFRRRSQGLLLAASLGGTFISLWLFLTAISTGHLATISAIVMCGPVFAAALESVTEKQWPSAYLLFALTLFGCGFYLLM